MVRTVHLRVAVHTALSQQVTRRHVGREALGAIRDTRMTDLRVTALAQERRTLRQHARMVRAMWGVTESAVLADRCVLPQVRTAHFSVALLAGVVDGLPHKICRGVVAVRAVATAAIHLALEERMRECLHRLAALQLVAVVADFGLCRRLQNGIDPRVTIVAINTSDLVDGVRTGMPAKADVAVVAVEALAIVFFNRRRAGRTEIRYRWPFLAPADAARMVTAGPVTSFALQLTVTERTTGIRRYGMLGTEYRKQRLVVMTGQAAIRAFAAVTGFLSVSGTDGQASQNGSRDYNCKQPHGSILSRRSIELEVAYAMYLTHIRRAACIVADTARFDAGGNQYAVRGLRGSEVTAVLLHVRSRQAGGVAARTH